MLNGADFVAIVPRLYHDNYVVMQRVMLLTQQRCVWRNLIEGHPTVLVDEETELLLIPLPRRPIDRLRGCVRVRVIHRPHGHIAAYATSSTLGRHPVREMRALAAA
jgi:hypothetical protein